MSSQLSALTVRLSGCEIGELLPDGRFEWADGWQRVAALNSSALSHSLPFGVPGSDPAPFFGGLLPEGHGLGQLARELQVDSANLFELLAAVGADVGGSVTIGEPRPPLPPIVIEEQEYDRILQRAYGYIRGGQASGGGSAAAGVQRKVALTLQESTGHWMLGRGSTPSSHILKPVPSGEGHTVRAEAYLNDICQQLGLSTHDAVVESAGEQDVLIVERYDRHRDDSGELHRLHQEDSAQGIGLPWGGDDKYENVNPRASLANVARLLPHRAWVFATPGSGPPETERERLLRLVVLNTLAGNTDAHSKNFSLMLPQVGEEQGRSRGVRLADAYDIVPQRLLSAEPTPLAMKISGRSDAGSVTASHLIAEGESWGISATASSATVERALADIIEAVTRTDTSRHGAPSRLPEFLLAQADNLSRGDAAWTKAVPPAIAFPARD